MTVDEGKIMIVKPKVRGFICTTAHPLGCQYHVKQQIDYVKSHPRIHGPANVLIIGASTGYGLASWISALFSARAKAVGVFFEKPASGKRTASAGWYNAAAVEHYAKQEDLYAASINGDAFSNEIKQQTCELIKEKMGKIDLVVYSLASPRRIMPDSGEVANSVLKTLNDNYVNQTVDPINGELKEIEINPATQEEIDDTVKVMGGDDWALWIKALQEQNLLADGVMTLAYSYIGPELTYPIYREGTIGTAKKHLEKTVTELDSLMHALDGKAYVSVNKALVTQASAAIPVVPLYISLLYKVMKERKIHEGCIEQIYRLFHYNIYAGKPISTDEDGRIRIDDLEMRKDVQDVIQRQWTLINANNLLELTDLDGYREDFYHLFGFNFDAINYDQEVDINVAIPSLEREAT